jgi:hypothetical protein
MESTLFDAVTDSSSLQRSSDCGNLLKEGILVNIKRVEKDLQQDDKITPVSTFKQNQDLPR